MATLKQKRLAKKLLENNGKSVSRAMREVGYARSTSKNPKFVVESKGWQELMEEFLPDKLLAQKHKDLLTVPKITKTYKEGELLIEEEELDSNAIKAGLDMGYKLKGKYSPEKLDLDPYKKLSNDELWGEIQRLRRELKIKEL